ncbi:arylalkylamine N-acetyltransferase 1-like [Styela clava]
MEDSGLEYRILQIGDMEDTMEILLRHFTSREPVSSHLNVDKTDWKTHFTPVLESAISQDVSIGVFDKSVLCGVAINVLSQGSQQGPSPRKPTPIKIRQALQLLQSMSQNFKEKNFLEIFIITVEQDYTKRGIASRLCVKSEEIARKLGLSCLSITCTSAYMQRAANRLGYQTMEKTFYKDYIDPITSEKIFETMPEPHECCLFMIKRL